MNVLFANPPWWERDEATGRIRAGIRAGSRWPFTMLAQSSPGRPVFGDYAPFPFFMGYAASFVAAKVPNAHVSFRDSITRRESYNQFEAELYNAAPDYVFVESATPSWDHDKRIIGRINSVVPRARIVVCGSIVAAKADEALALPGVVATIAGEYEKGAVEAVNGRTGKIPHALLTTDEMNAAPFPMMDRDCAKWYHDGCPKGQVYPHAHIWASRGCPFRCIFCVWPAVMTGNDPDGTGKRSVRCYSPAYMETYIRSIVEEYGYKSIYFDDDTFNLRDDHTRRMCEVMRKVGLPWSAMCRADTLKEDTWQMMADAGCFGVKIGMESASQRVIDKIVNKRLNIAEVISKWMPLIRKTGMTVHTTWTVGLPGETDDERKLTVETIQRLYDEGLHQSHQLSGTAEIEGTPLSTLTRLGHLSAYEDATTATGYVRSADGQRKIEGMTK